MRRVLDTIYSVAGGIAADEGWPLYLDRFAQLLTRES